MNVVDEIVQQRTAGRTICAIQDDNVVGKGREIADRVVQAHDLRGLGDGWLMISGADAHAIVTALLHDVGRLVVDSHYPLEAAQAIAWAEEHDMPHSEAEHTLLGIDHTELGEWVCRHWRFSSDVVEAIAGHHRPPPAGPVSLIDVVHVADAITHALDIAGAATEAVPGVNPMAWARLNLHEDDLPALLASIESEFNDLLAVLRPAKETP